VNAANLNTVFQIDVSGTLTAADIEAITAPTSGILFLAPVPPAIDGVLKTHLQIDDFSGYTDAAVAFKTYMDSNAATKTLFNTVYGIAEADQIFTKAAFRQQVIDIVATAGYVDPLDFFTKLGDVEGTIGRFFTAYAALDADAKTNVNRAMAAYTLEADPLISLDLTAGDTANNRAILMDTRYGILYDVGGPRLASKTLETHEAVGYLVSQVNAANLNTVFQIDVSGTLTASDIEAITAPTSGILFFAPEPPAIDGVLKTHLQIDSFCDYTDSAVAFKTYMDANAATKTLFATVYGIA
jgi:hypothetical protein